VSSDVTYALEHVITGGTGKSAAIGRPAAGKTGTTSGNVSAWFVGYTPQLSASVAMFRDNNAPLQNIAGYSQLYGGDLPAQMWSAFMKAALLHVKAVQFPPPATAVAASPSPSATVSPTPTLTPSSSPPVSPPASSPVSSVPASSLPASLPPEEPPGSVPVSAPASGLAGAAVASPGPG
jgi:membrane peptidoglycan carboxypeptidase